MKRFGEKVRGEVIKELKEERERMYMENIERIMVYNHEIKQKANVLEDEVSKELDEMKVHLEMEAENRKEADEELLGEVNGFLNSLI